MTYRILAITMTVAAIACALLAAQAVDEHVRDRIAIEDYVAELRENYRNEVLTRE